LGLALNVIAKSTTSELPKLQFLIIIISHDHYNASRAINGKFFKKLQLGIGGDRS
jgi:hypothetical protein